VEKKDMSGLLVALVIVVLVGFIVYRSVDKATAKNLKRLLLALGAIVLLMLISVLLCARSYS